MTKKLLVIVVSLLMGASAFASEPLFEARGDFNAGFHPGSGFLGMPGFAQLNPDSIPFAPAVDYDVGGSPSSVFCADLDGDNDLDLAVANLVGNNVSIL